MKKIGIIIGMLLILAAVPATAWAGTYSGGSGTSGDPYQIQNLDDLQELQNTSADWDCYFIQTDNIDASATSGWNGGDGFDPIGGTFSGEYDGQGYVIDSLYINRPSVNDVGLFSYVTGLSGHGEIKNLGVTNVNISGNWHVGAIAGLIEYGAKISNCYSTGAINATGHAGGIAGQIRYTNSEIRNCYSHVDVEISNQIAGGILGTNLVDSQVNYCYCTGNVTGGNEMGAVIGSNENFGDTGYSSDCFWDTEESNFSGADDGVGDQDASTSTVYGRTTAQMKTKSTFTDAGWDFTDTWEMTEGVTYPLLRGLEGQPPIPEWPMIALFSAGVLALAAFVVYKKRRAVTIAA